MATIERISRREGPVYKAKVRRKGHPTACRTFKNHSDAKKWARRLEVSIDRDKAGLTDESQRHTISEAIATYTDDALTDLSRETHRKYAQHFRYWEAALGSLKLSECTPPKISQHRDKLAETMAPATVNHYLAALGAVFTYCVERKHWLQHSPMSQVAKPRVRNGVIRFLSQQELDTLLLACRESPSKDLYLAVLLSVTTGGRQAEILGLRWEDVDLDRQLLFLRTRTGNTNKGGARSVPIPARALAPLAARKDARPVVTLHGDDLVFPSTVSRDKPITLRKPWKSALSKAGITDFRWHDMRHTAASFHAAQGATLQEIGALLGHGSMTTTLRYAHLTESRLHDLARSMADEILR